MFQTDSIDVTTVAGEEQMVVKHYPPTPAQILSWLPKNATPAQQDSAIQAHIKPCEIHWSERPDTLHLPGHTPGKSALDVSIPQYYKESFFSDKEYFHPEITGGRRGVAGDPMPYTVAADNFMSSLLICCCIVTMVSLSRSRSFIVRQIKSFFYVQRSGTTEVMETSTEVRFQLLLIAEACLLFSILLLFYMRERVSDVFTVGQSHIIELFSGVFAAYYLLKQLLYWVVNWIFFEKKNIKQWTKANLFLTASQGAFLLPLVLVQSFFFLPFNSLAVYLIIIVIVFKLLTFYKQKQIFFPQKDLLLQNILYFCALEMSPLSLLWSILVIISEHLEINF